MASRNVDAVDLLLDMPWASTASIVSAMRAMHDPFVFERVCERLATRRAHELETKERVGGLTALGFAAKKKREGVGAASWTPAPTPTRRITRAPPR